MLPEQLSTGVSSLGETEDKLSIVIEFVVGSDGIVHSGNVYRAILRNKAQLTYNAVGAWLEDKGAAPDKVGASTELQSQLKLQDEVAQALKNERYRHGALNIETIEVHPLMLNEKIVDVVRQEKNRATERWNLFGHRRASRISGRCISRSSVVRNTPPPGCLSPI